MKPEDVLGHRCQRCGHFTPKCIHMYFIVDAVPGIYPCDEDLHHRCKKDPGLDGKVMQLLVMTPVSTANLRPSDIDQILAHQARKNDDLYNDD